MTQASGETIGLSELIDKVKQDLLFQASQKPNGKGDIPPILFVDSVELELQVTVKREGNAGVKIDVLSVGGGQAGGAVAQEKVHTVKVTLSPLFEKEQLVAWYKDIHSGEVAPAVNASMEALIKGQDGNDLADRY